MSEIEKIKKLFKKFKKTYNNSSISLEELAELIVWELKDAQEINQDHLIDPEIKELYNLVGHANALIISTSELKNNMSKLGLELG